MRKRPANRFSYEKFGIRRCFSCKVFKLAEEFSSAATRPCKECQRRRVSQYRLKRQAAVMTLKLLLGEKSPKTKVLSERQRERNRQYHKAYREKYPERKSADNKRYVASQTAAVRTLELLIKQGDENDN